MALYKIQNPEYLKQGKTQGKKRVEKACGSKLAFILEAFAGDLSDPLPLLGTLCRQRCTKTAVLLESAC